jgi:hypothetical protein
MVKMNEKVEDMYGYYYTPSPDYKASFRAGLNFAADMKSISIHAGVFYAAKGYQVSFMGDRLKLNLHYIDVPVYVNYNIINTGGNKFFAGVGPYISYCAGGKAKLKSTAIDPSVTVEDQYTLSIGTDAFSDDIKPLDLGANANLGFISSSGIYVRAQYSLGLANTWPGGDSKNSLKNVAFGVSVGYQIGLNKKNKVATAQ